MHSHQGMKERSGRAASDEVRERPLVGSGATADLERTGRRKAGEGAGSLRQRRPVIGWDGLGRLPGWALAVAGIVGPILFTLGFLVQEFFRVGEYSPIAETVSALEAGPYGWVQQVNFIVFGILTTAFARGLHLGMHSTRAGVAGPAILAWSGVGLVLAAVFPLREDAAGATYDPTGLHFVNGLVFFLSIGVGLILISRRMASDPRWHSLAAYALGTGVALLVMFVATRILVVPDDAPLHPWAGLAQRAVLAVWFPCTLVLAHRLWRVARGAAPTH